MSRIYPSIVIHEINTYAMTRPIREKLCSIHRRKYAVIKVEVEKILKAGFFYPMHLTEWVSNIVPENKK